VPQAKDTQRRPRLGRAAIFVILGLVAGRGGRARRPAVRWGQKKGQQTTSRPPSSSRKTRDRGSTAVEFALVLPLLLLIVFGIIDFGRALNAQITLTGAAREGVRLVALGYTDAAVQARVAAAAPSLNGITVTVAASCPPGAGPTANAEVNVSYSFSFITPIGAVAGVFGGSGLGAPIVLTAQGVMPCET
jgi:Flp pilus assembly protein TadG